MAALSRVISMRFYKQNASLVQQIPRCNAFFGRKKDATGSPAAEGARDDGRPRNDDENRHSTKHNLGLLKTKRSLDTKKGYKPPAQARQVVLDAVTPLVRAAANQDLSSVSLEDPLLKYKVLSRLIREFDHDVPNCRLNDMKTIADVITYFETEVRQTSSYEDLRQLDLPPNLHIELDYKRFDPQDPVQQQLFGGKTAFPGRDTIVTSIKYRRKYGDIKTTPEKPGYINHYYGY